MHPTHNVYRPSEPINEKNNEISIEWFYALYEGELYNLGNEFKYSHNRLPDEFISIAHDYVGMTFIGIKEEEL